MKAIYLIASVDQFCKENQLDISKVYKKMGEVYQNTYGVNIVKQMEDNKKWDIAYYLEELSIVERYVTILNGLKNMIKEGWNLELD
jgi:hypothetical protein